MNEGHSKDKIYLAYQNAKPGQWFHIRHGDISITNIILDVGHANGEMVYILLVGDLSINSKMINNFTPMAFWWGDELNHELINKQNYKNIIEEKIVINNMITTTKVTIEMDNGSIYILCPEILGGMLFLDGEEELKYVINYGNGYDLTKFNLPKFSNNHNFNDIYLSDPKIGQWIEYEEKIHLINDSGYKTIGRQKQIIRNIENVNGNKTVTIDTLNFNLDNEIKRYISKTYTAEFIKIKNEGYKTLFKYGGGNITTTVIKINNKNMDCYVMNDNYFFEKDMIFSPQIPIEGIAKKEENGSMLMQSLIDFND
jgi:hypothetical protein